MKVKKSFWASITGGLTSATPVLLSCCKSGACVGVCASPIASLFGVSSATLVSSPIMGILEPLLIALSAISFTISYYSLYVLPKLNCVAEGSCECKPDSKALRKVKINKIVFWLGLILSIGFLSYFEYSKYNSMQATACSPAGCFESSSVDSSACDPSGCVQDEASSCSENGSSGDCCEKEQTDVSKSEITCPKCGFKKTETMPNDVCQLKYTCSQCQAVVFPKNGDCCVFCSYGDKKCPSKQ